MISRNMIARNFVICKFAGAYFLLENSMQLFSTTLSSGTESVDRSEDHRPTKIKRSILCTLTFWQQKIQV